MEGFTITLTVTREQIANLLCSALEGGSNYWITRVLPLEPQEWVFTSEPEVPYHYLHDYPLNPGGSLLVIDTLSDSDGVLTLDQDSVQRGLITMAEQYPRHFTDILMEETDALTGDIFLQCCVLGEVLYG